MTKKDKFILENDFIKLIFDERTGSLESIINKTFKRDLITFKGRPQLFRIVYAIDDYRGHHFDSEKQKVDNIALSKDGDVKMATITYKTLRSTKGIFKVEITINIELADESDEVHMRIEVQNNDQGQITQVWFPWIRGITAVGDDPDKDVLAYPLCGGSLITNPMNYFPGKRMFLDFHEWTRDSAKTILAKPYPGFSSMQWMDLGCEDHGVYMACLNKNGDFLVPRVQKHVWDKEEHLSFAMVKYPYISQGDSWMSPNYILSPHVGDWHMGADKYRRWLESWLTKREKADWAKFTNGFYHFILRHQDGTTINRIEEIPEILYEAKDHGINMLFICGWYKGGHDGKYEPDYDPNSPEKLKEAFEIIHKSGGRFLLYLNSRAYNMDHPNFKNEGYKWAQKAYDGLLLTETWGWAVSHYPSYEAVSWAKQCPSSKGWQNRFMEQMRKVAELGADCGLLDELLDLDLCHDPDHGHNRPESSFGPGALEMLQKNLKVGRELNPEFELAMEGLVDIYTPYVAIFHSRVDFADCANPEVFRYTLPWVTGITGGFLDMGLKDKLYESFLLGLPLDIEMHTHNRGRISFDPELSKEIKRVNMMRDDNKDLFIEGEFRDTVGIEVSNKQVSVKLFRSSAAALLTIWNQGKRSSLIRLVLDLSKVSLEFTSPKAYLYKGQNSDEYIPLFIKSKEGKIFLDIPYIDAGNIALIRLVDKEN